MKVQFNITVDTEGELTEAQQMQLAHNLNCAILAAANREGISPTDESVVNTIEITSNNGTVSLGNIFPSQVVTGTKETGDHLLTQNP